MVMSFLVSVLAVTDLFFIPEYWNPVTMFPIIGGKVDALAFVFCFEIGGIAAVLYEEFMGERCIREAKNRHHPLKILLLLSPLSLILLRIFTTLNFMTDTLIALIIGVLIILFVRGDLVKDLLLGGLFLTLIYGIFLSLYLMIFPYVIHVWNFKDYPQFFVGNVPHVEILWALLSGAFLSPLYEFANDFDVRKIPSKGRLLKK